MPLHKPKHLQTTAARAKKGDAAEGLEADEASSGKKRKAPEPADEKAGGASGEGKPDGKPIKWKKMITKELETCGGRMNLKELRKAVVAEVQAHPSHGGRKAAQLKEEFDQVLPTFHKYRVEGSQVLMVKAEDK